MKILFIVFAILVIASLIYLNIYTYFGKNANTIQKLISYLSLAILIITTVFMFHLEIGLGVLYLVVLVGVFAFINIIITEKMQCKYTSFTFVLCSVACFLIIISILSLIAVPFIETETKVSNETVNLKSYNLNNNLSFVLIELNEKGEYCVRNTLNPISTRILFKEIESIEKVRSDEKIVRHKYIKKEDSLISYFGFCDSKYITYEKYTVYLIY